MTPFMAKAKQTRAETMQISFITLDRFLIAELSGAIDSRSAGYLYDALVGSVGDGSTQLVVNLAWVNRVTHAGMRGLIVAARMLRHGGGAMRICGADASTEDFLQSLGFGDLLHCDPTVAASIAALSAGQLRPAATMAGKRRYGVI